MINKAKGAVKPFVVTRADIIDIVFGVFAFFIGRVEIFGSVNPLLTPYVSSRLFTGRGFYISLFFAALGLLTRFSFVYSFKYFIALGLLLVSNALLQPYAKNRVLVSSVLGGVIATTSGMLLYAVFGFSLYVTVLSVLEGALAASLNFIIRRGKSLLSDKNAREAVLSIEELIGVSVIASGIIAGSADIFIGEISLRIMFSAYFTLLCAYGGGYGAGCAGGLLTGLVLYAAQTEHPAYAIVLAASGVASGGLNHTNRVLPALAFLFAFFPLMFFLSPDSMSVGAVLSALFAGAAFILTPQAATGRMNAVINSPRDNDMLFADTVREITSERLAAYESVFENLSLLFRDSAKKQGVDRESLPSMIDRVTLQTCANCSKSDECWRKGFYDTYSDFTRTLKLCDENGKISADDLSVHMRKRCVLAKDIVTAMNTCVEAHKQEIFYKNKLAEAKTLVRLQLDGAGGSMRRLSRELTGAFTFLPDEARRLWITLSKKNIKTEGVVVYKDAAGKLFAHINMPVCGRRSVCEEFVIPAVNEILRKPMKRQYSDCRAARAPYDSNIRMCGLRLCEDMTYKVNRGLAVAKKYNSAASGDCHTFFDDTKGRFLMALSDGMGTGESAREQSGRAMGLLDEFARTGFDTNTSVKMINSALFLSSSTETYCTLDIAVINLYTGEMEISKVGASATYIISGGEIKSVESKSLPVGILSDIAIEVTKLGLNDGDIIIMATDGLIDAIDNYVYKERWILDIYKKGCSRNPQEIADNIVEAALRERGQKPSDDVTVLCSRIWS